MNVALMNAEELGHSEKNGVICMLCVILNYLNSYPISKEKKGVVSLVACMNDGGAYSGFFM
jgi:hypothetical protein